MYFIFRPGANIAERVAIIVLLAVLLAGIYGFFVSFIPSDDYIPVAIVIALVIGAILILPFILWWDVNKSMPGKIAKTIRYFLIYAVLTGIGFVATISTCPYAITLAIGKPHKEQAIVRSKNTSMKRCSNELYVNKNKSVLCVSKYVWEEINKGDTVILYGKLSALGFSVTNVEKKQP